MQTLNEPLFELCKESDHYRVLKEVKDSQPRIKEILKNVADEFNFKAGDFAFYGSRGFGFYEGTESYEKFKEQLTKKPDKNRIHTFKRTSPTFKLISPKVLEIERIKSKVSPFALHDIFGINNLVASQWIGDQYFVEVKSESVTKDYMNSDNRKKQFIVEPVKEINYKDYLELVMGELNAR